MQLEVGTMVPMLAVTHEAVTHEAVTHEAVHGGEGGRCFIQRRSLVRDADRVDAVGV